MATILVIEDDTTVAELLQTTLEMNGYGVVVAHDGADALDKLGVNRRTMNPVRPDLIILDLFMPRVDGYSVLRELAKSPEFSKIPVIVLTAKTQMRDMVLYERNVAAFIPKPFDANDVIANVKKALATKP